MFTPDDPSWTPVDLPDITADALCYLTASELCPAEYGELYSKLMYKYRDICLNAYNCESSENGRNTFFKRNIRNLTGKIKVGKEEKRTSLGESTKECSPSNIFLGQWGSCKISNLQNCEIINVCCFKPLNLC